MAVSGAENYASIGAILTEVVIEGIAQVIPEHAVLQKMTPFDSKLIKSGLKLVQPTLVRYPDGFSHVLAGVGPVQLNPAKAGKIERAEIVSNNIYLVDAIDKDMIDRCKQDNGKYDKPAVKQATAVLFPALIAAAKREEEMVTLYGQSGRGAATYANSSWSGIVATVAGVTAVTVDKASWGPGLWTGSEGMDLTFFDDSNNTCLATASLAAVNMDTRTLTLDANVTTALQTATTGPISIWRSSTRKALSGTPQYNESIGLQAILANTGTLFNIDASKYNLYRSPQFSAGSAALSLAKVLSLSSRASYTGTGSGAVLLVPVDSWTDLSTAETGMRRWLDGPTGAVKIGPDALTFYGATGSMAIKAHPMLKRGGAMLLNLNANSGTPGGDLKRVGDCEWTYDTTGAGDMLHYVPGLSGYEIRLKANKGTFMNPPGRSANITSIVDGQA